MTASLPNRVLGHFDLRDRRARAPEAAPATDQPAPDVALRPWWYDALWVGTAYVAQVLGVVGKQVYDDIMQNQGPRVNLMTLVLAAIVSAVTFPTVYRALEAQTGRSLRLFLAFQNGFFWQSVLGQVAPR